MSYKKAAPAVIDLRPYVERPNPLLIVLSGPSGVGKDAVIKRMKELGYPFHFVVTATTRPRRPHERDGIDYHFLTEEEFDSLLKRDEFLEHAVVYGNRMGIPKQEVREGLDSGQDVVMRVDVQGAATLRKLVPEAVFIFLIAPSEEALFARLRSRKTESAEALQLRLALAREEMKRLYEFDYVVVNRDGALDTTVEKIMAIITAEKCRVCQRVVAL